jgi:hypothetical protein
VSCVQHREGSGIVRVAIALGIACVVAVLAAPSAHAAATITASCDPAPADCSGWYRTDVTVTWAVTPDTAIKSGCDPILVTADTAGTTLTCTADDGSGPVSQPVTIKLDKTPPEVTAAIPDRQADVNGWYVRPVIYSFTGSDPLSGGVICPPAIYSGPDSVSAAVVGTCTDQAGNTAARAFPLMYDATPPTLTDLTALVGNGTITLSWQSGADTASVEVLRTPGIGAPSSVVYGGPGEGFVDQFVADGVAYTYRVTLRDGVGNANSQTIVAVPGAPQPDPTGSPSTNAPVAAAPAGATEPIPNPSGRRILPAAGAVFRAGQLPLLRWPAPRRARYYNVQLFRSGRKVLSVWPARPRYQLKLRWTFRGKPQKLVPGHYRWMVWPGFGRRSKAVYGKRIVSRRFDVRRAPSGR